MADKPLSKLPEVVEMYVSRLCYFVVHFLCIVLPMESFNDSKHDALCVHKNLIESSMD